jgi:hypothetical protein
MVVNVKKTIFLGYVTMLSGRYTQTFQINLLSAPSGQRQQVPLKWYIRVSTKLYSHIYLPPWFTEDVEEQENH